MAKWPDSTVSDRKNLGRVLVYGEDGVFVMAARDAGFELHIAADTGCSSLYILRHDNTSQCFPQFMLPDFLLTRILGPGVLPMAGR
jgi:hypothetical protein